MDKKNIAIIVESENDLAQCRDGLKFLKRSQEIGFIKIYIINRYRHAVELQMLLADLVAMGVDMAIIGPESFYADAFLRYTLRTNKMPIIGVSFHNEHQEEFGAKMFLSFNKNYETQIFCKDKNDHLFIGEEGFLRACKFALTEDLTDKVTIPQDRRMFQDLTLEEAINLANETRKK